MPPFLFKRKGEELQIKARGKMVEIPVIVDGESYRQAFILALRNALKGEYGKTVSTSQIRLCPIIYYSVEATWWRTKVIFPQVVTNGFAGNEENLTTWLETEDESNAFANDFKNGEVTRFRFTVGLSGLDENRNEATIESSAIRKTDAYQRLKSDRIDLGNCECSVQMSWMLLR
jgi:hypothetical protein